MLVDEVVGTDTGEDVTVEIEMEPVPLAAFFVVPSEEDVVVEPSFCPVVELSLVLELTGDVVEVPSTGAGREGVDGTVGTRYPADGRRISLRPLTER